MRRDKNSRERQEKPVTIADLCQGIEQRRIPSLRQGDQYVVREADVRRLRAQSANSAQRDRLLDDSLEMTPGRETSSLEVGRPA